jgi:hypothetical protein
MTHRALSRGRARRAAECARAGTSRNRAGVKPRLCRNDWDEPAELARAFNAGTLLGLGLTHARSAGEASRKGE